MGHPTPSSNSLSQEQQKKREAEVLQKISQIWSDVKNWQKEIFEEESATEVLQLS